MRARVVAEFGVPQVVLGAGGGARFQAVSVAPGLRRVSERAQVAAAWAPRREPASGVRNDRTYYVFYASTTSVGAEVDAASDNYLSLGTAELQQLLRAVSL